MLEKSLNDKEHGDFTINKNHALINKIENDYIEKNAEKPLNSNSCGCHFINNSKYHCITITEANVSLTKILSNHGRDIFCLSYFCNINTDAKNNYYVKTLITVTSQSNKKSNKIFLRSLKKAKKKSNKTEEVPGNVLKHMVEDNYLQHQVYVGMTLTQ